MRELPPPKSGALRHPAQMHLKGALFALMSMALAVLLTRDGCIAALVALTAWSSARAYSYAFDVIERYVDPTFRFAGLWSVVRYLRSRHRRRRASWKGLHRHVGRFHAAIRLGRRGLAPRSPA